MAGWSYENNVTMNNFLKYGYVQILQLEQCQQILTRIQSTSSILCSKANPYVLVNHVNINIYFLQNFIVFKSQEIS
jgi:hypothetical protein